MGVTPYAQHCSMIGRFVKMASFRAVETHAMPINDKDKGSTRLCDIDVPQKQVLPYD